jgi:hypothetical protein
MRYIDKYPGCVRCPVEQYCGTMVSSIKLCNSYKEQTYDEYLDSLTPEEFKKHCEDIDSDYYIVHEAESVPLV